MRQLNEQLARSPQEVELFNKMDEQADLWPGYPHQGARDPALDPVPRR